MTAELSISCVVIMSAAMAAIGMARATQDIKLFVWQPQALAQPTW